jgi:hypothetical protein
MQASVRTDLSISKETDFEAWARGLPFPASLTSTEEPPRDETPSAGQVGEPD